jgi:hypothetical protein
MTRVFVSAIAAVVFAAQQPPSAPATLERMPPLHGEALAYDPIHDRLVVLGGRTPTDWLQGTWEWDGRRWEQTVPPSHSPEPRGGHALGYDLSAAEMVLFGGSAGPTRWCDTWVRAGTSWTRANTECVTDRARNASLIYDAKARRQLLLEGPALGDDARSLRMWERRGQKWVLIDEHGPRRSGFSAAAYDAARGVLVVPVLFGGPDAGTWEWNGQSWSRSAATLPVPRQTYALTYDPRRRRVVLAGGQGSTAGPYFDDMWEWDGIRWSTLVQPGPRPPARAGAALIAQPARSRLLYFGGYGEGLRGDFWALDANGWRRLDAEPQR